MGGHGTWRARSQSRSDKSEGGKTSISHHCRARQISFAQCTTPICDPRLRRLLRHERHVALPELLLTKALCTGEQRDFDAYWEAQRVTFADLRFAEGFMKAAIVHARRAEDLCAVPLRKSARPWPKLPSPKA